MRYPTLSGKYTLMVT